MATFGFSAIVWLAGTALVEMKNEECHMEV
jgi:hypothetical protein